jgi:hypothetical protein
MASLTRAEFNLLQQLKDEGGWLIMDRDKSRKYEGLENGGYVGIQVINPSKVYCQVTAKGRALLEGSS